MNSILSTEQHHDGELEQLLVQRAILTPHQLQLAQHYSRFASCSIGEAIIALELADELEVIRAMSDVIGEVGEVQSDISISDEMMQRIETSKLQLSARVSEERSQVVIGQEKQRIYVATSNVLDAGSFAKTRRFFSREGFEVVFVATTHLQISMLQQRFYGVGQDLRDYIYQHFDDIEAFSGKIHEVLSTIIQMAVLEQASDVFFMLNKEDEVNFIYFKVNKEKQFRLAVPRACQESMHRAIKIDAGMDSGRVFGHQDGSLTIKIIQNRYRINLRVSSISTVSGEQITLRIQALKQSKAKLTDLGFKADDAQRIIATIERKHGLIVLSGSTGSGKTTTLYTLLDHFKVDETNIITMEDPVEIRRRGMNQIQINEAAGQSFRESIRVCLRQAPDIILIGEIRDHETAERAVEAANTGHMVFCTIHANSVEGIPLRLKELGVNQIESFTANMALAIHQELVPDQNKVALRYELGGRAFSGSH